MYYSGSQWGVWTGGEGDTRIAVLVTIVTGGFHSQTRYQWSSSDEGDLQGEIYPVVYVTRRCSYTCTCSIAAEVVLTLSFTVEGVVIIVHYRTLGSISTSTYIRICNWNGYLYLYGYFYLQGT